MEADEKKYRVASTPSQRILAVGVMLAFCYWGASVVVPLLVSILLAYFLDPGVNLLEKLHLPRALAALIALLVALTFLGGLGWILVDRADEFSRDWPTYRAPLRKTTEAIEHRMESFEAGVSEIAPPPSKEERRAIEIAPLHPVREVLFDRLPSIFPMLLGVSFIPFLVFFMLAAKRQAWHATMQLFPTGQRTEVKTALEELGAMLRGYVVGILLVTLTLVVSTWAFFWYMGLKFAFLTALVSGIFSMVPYIGMILAWLPPLLIGLSQFSGITNFIIVAVVLALFHTLATNLLFPSVVGRRLRLNAVAVTISMLFWAWMWGAIGLLLAIPIAASIKVVCDHVESWRPFGRWMSA
jgi:predicted PurR-regulated permease PerM